jgi:hypothetical protein
MRTFGTTSFAEKTWELTEKPLLKDRKGWPGGIGYAAAVKGPDGEIRTAWWKLSVEYFQESHCCYEEENHACDWEHADEVI